ncbi:transposase [Streptococcus pneumoniae]|nr:transposase [Streptococcus pneumoniae]
MSRVHVQIMNQFHRKSHEYKTIKHYWKLIQQDSRKLSDKRFYRPTFRMHLTNKEILNKLLSYSEPEKGTALAFLSFLFISLVVNVLASTKQTGFPEMPVPLAHGTTIERLQHAIQIVLLS